MVNRRFSPATVDPIRIAYVLLSPTFGMHQYTAGLAAQMAGAGHDVRVVTTRHAPTGRYSPHLSVETVASTRTTGLSRETLDRRQRLAIGEYLLGQNVDVVHFSGPHLWNSALIRQLRRDDVPTVHTLHDLDPHAGERYGRLLYLWNRLVLRSGATILVHGRRYRERLVRNGRPPHTVAFTPLLHTFLSHAAYNAWRHAAPLPRSGVAPNILFFGRLEHYKGLETLVEAFAALENLTPPPTLTIAGPGDPPRRLPAGISGRIDLRNRRIGDDEGIELFLNCSLVVLPYTDASQSAIIASAYFFHKPVIVSDVGALAEYVVPGETGFVVPPADPAALAAALRRALTDPALLREMGAAGRLWYDRQCRRERAELHALYQRVAALRGRVAS